MRTLQGWMARFAGMFSRARRERELADELDSHLAMHIEDNIRDGMSLGEARRQAILKLGGVEPTKEAYRDRGTLPLIENTLQDARFSIRQLRKNPGFACTAILIMALGMCASVAIFAFVDAALIQPLPYPDPNRLAGVTETTPMFPRANLSYPDYLDWKRMNKVFRSLDVFTGTGYLLSTPSGVEPVRATRVSDGFFQTLGANTVLGRNFYTGEDLPSAPRTVILTYSCWQKRFGGRANAIGQAITLSGVPHVIVGVLPKSFQFAPRGNAEFWTTIHASGTCDQNRSCHGLDGIARLKDGVSMQSALANMTTIADQLEKQYPGSNRGQGASVMPLAELIVGVIRPMLLVLLGGAGLLLLIACVNIASLLLVRSEGRKREIAVRVSLGASSGRLISQFVTESFLLTASGSVLGLLLAQWALRLLKALIPADMMSGMPFWDGLGLNMRALIFASLIALTAAGLFAAMPTVRLRFAQVREGLAEGSRGSAGNTWRRLGSNLVVVELAIAMVLLAGAGLLGKSFYRLLHVELGFQPAHLATMNVLIPPAGYAKDEQVVALARQVQGRVANLPGVTSAAIANILPVSFNGNTEWIRFVGRPYHGEHNEVNLREVSSAYFTTIHAKLLRGRYFSDAEDASKPLVVIINQALARQYFPGEDPIGQRFGNDDLNPKSIRQIVGVVNDIKDGSLDSEIWPAVYYPFNQSTETDFSVVARTSQDEASLLAAMSAAVRGINRDIATMGEATMNARINDSPSAYLHRSAAWLVASFAGLALLLGVVGLYGVIAYSVGQRTREIGVRMALGAERRTVYKLILKEAGWLIGAGIAVGLSCSLAAAGLLKKLLFGVTSWDVPTLGAVAVVLAGAALLASYFPARRAASVNPIEALRAE